MTRLLRSPSRVLLVCALLFGAGACDKPTPGDCRKALENMKHLLGTENLGTTANLEGEVRRCRGGSSRKAVACAIKASTLEELKACDFYKEEVHRATSGSAAGSAGAAAKAPAAAGSASAGAATAGSAATTGSAPTGSAATGSAPTGSAATGAAATGSASAGATTGSAATGSAGGPP